MEVSKVCIPLRKNGKEHQVESMRRRGWMKQGQHAVRLRRRLLGRGPGVRDTLQIGCWGRESMMFCMLKCRFGFTCSYHGDFFTSNFVSSMWLIGFLIGRRQWDRNNYVSDYFNLCITVIWSDFWSHKNMAGNLLALSCVYYAERKWAFRNLCVTV